MIFLAERKLMYTRLGFIIAFLIALITLCTPVRADSRCIVNNLASSFEESGLQELVPNEILRANRFALSSIRIPNAKKSPLETVERINRFAPPSNPRRIAAIDAGTAQDLHRAIANHPIAGNLGIQKYNGRDIHGLCFGQAMAVHLEALARGIQKERIYKAWVLGPMPKSPNPSIRSYHVTTIIKNSEGGWWAVDPSFPSAMRLEDWVSVLQSYAEDDRPLQLFVTDASRLTHGDPQKYRKRIVRNWRTPLLYDGLESLDYKGFFNDLLRHFRAERILKPASN